MALDLAVGKATEDHVMVDCELVVRQSCGCISPLVKQVEVVTPAVHVNRTTQDVIALLSKNRLQILSEMIRTLVDRGFAALEATERVDRVSGCFY